MEESTSTANAGTKRMGVAEEKGMQTERVEEEEKTEIGSDEGTDEEQGLVIAAAAAASAASTSACTSTCIVKEEKAGAKSAVARIGRSRQAASKSAGNKHGVAAAAASGVAGEVKAGAKCVKPTVARIGCSKHAASKISSNNNNNEEEKTEVLEAQLDGHQLELLNGDLATDIEPLPIRRSSVASLPGAYAQAGPQFPLAEQDADIPQVAHQVTSEEPSAHSFGTHTTHATAGAGAAGDNSSASLENSESLVVASPVSDVPSNHLDLPQAQQWSDRKTRRNSKSTTWRTTSADGLSWQTILVITSCFLILLITVVVLIVQFRPQKDSPDNSLVEDGKLSDQTPQEYLLSILPDYTLEAIFKEDNTTESPQSKALQWLLEDKHLPYYPSWRAIQRFALATIFYATGKCHTIW